jgi:ElaB/YqjD/DUF883 family membrane-anchored ribosome-binding protein
MAALLVWMVVDAVHDERLHGEAVVDRATLRPIANLGMPHSHATRCRERQDALSQETVQLDPSTPLRGAAVMTDTIKTRTDTAEIESLKDELDTLRKTVATIAKQMGNGAAKKIAENGHEFYDVLHDRGERVVRAASHEIEERPLTSVLIAFAAGFVGGRLLSR